MKALAVSALIKPLSTLSAAKAWEVVTSAVRRYPLEGTVNPDQFTVGSVVEGFLEWVVEI